MMSAMTKGDGSRIGSYTLDVYQTLVDLQHGNDQIKNKGVGISALGSDGSSLSNNYGGRRSDNDMDQALGMIGSGINGSREPSDKNPL